MKQIRLWNKLSRKTCRWD